MTTKHEFLEALQKQLNAKILWEINPGKKQPFILTSYSVNGRVFILQSFKRSTGAIFYFSESFYDPAAATTWQDHFDFIQSKFQFFKH